jgi:hypothetical protein
MKWGAGAKIFGRVANIFWLGVMVFCGLGAKLFCSGAKVFCPGAKISCRVVKIPCHVAEFFGHAAKIFWLNQYSKSICLAGTMSPEMITIQGDSEGSS